MDAEIQSGGIMSDLKLAKLTKEQVKEIQELESLLGVSLVAYFEENNRYADLDQNSIDKLKDLERKLGIVILAYPLSKAS